MNWVSVRNPIEKNDIENLEKELDIQLPEDYKEKIGPINGGALKSACIVFDGKRISYSRNISLLKSSKANVYQLLGGKIDGKSFFPFASVGNGDLFCFDLKNNQVILWLHETDNIIEICKSFSDLMDMIIQE